MQYSIRGVIGFAYFVGLVSGYSFVRFVVILSVCQLEYVKLAVLCYQAIDICVFIRKNVTFVQFFAYSTHQKYC